LKIKPFFIGTKLVQADIGPIFVSSIVPGRSARVGVWSVGDLSTGGHLAPPSAGRG